MSLVHGSSRPRTMGVWTDGTFRPKMRHPASMIQSGVRPSFGDPSSAAAAAAAAAAVASPDTGGPLPLRNSIGLSSSLSSLYASSLSVHGGVSQSNSSASSASFSALRTCWRYTRIPPVAVQSRFRRPPVAAANSSAARASRSSASPVYLASSFGPHHTKLPSPWHRTSALGCDGGAPRSRQSFAALFALRSFQILPGHHTPAASSVCVWYFCDPLRNAHTRVPAEYPSGGGISRRGSFDCQSSSSPRTP